MVFSSSGVTLIRTGPLLGCAWGGDEVGKGPGGQLSRDFRHDVNLHENGALFAVRAVGKVQREGVGSVPQPAGNDFRQARVVEFMRGNVVYVRLDGAAGAVHQNFCDVFGRRADRRHGGNFSKGLEAVLLHQDGGVAALEAFLDGGQAGEVEEARLVVFPFAVFVGEQQDQGVGVRRFLAQPQVHLAVVGGRGRGTVHHGAHVHQRGERGRSHGLPEQGGGKGAFFRDGQVAHFHLAVGGGGGSPAVIVAAQQVQAPCVVGYVQIVPQFGVSGPGGGGGGGEKSCGAAGHGENGAESHYTII